MQIILPHDHFDADHLEAVKADMQRLGAPTIKAVWMDVYGAWVALEGSHRIRAAATLGLEPVIDEIEYSDALVSEVAPGSFEDDYTVAQICDDAYSNEAIRFEAAE